jgi:ATP-dependent Zn protease
MSYYSENTERARGLFGRGYSAMSKYMHNYGLEDYLKDYAQNSIKKKFGFEFFLDSVFRFNSADSYNNDLHEFLNNIFDFDIRKLIDEKIFENYINLKKIGDKAYAFIATGRYIPHKIQDAMIFGNDNNHNISCEVYLYIFGKNSVGYAKKLNKILATRKKVTNSELRNYIVNVCTSNDKDIDSIFMPSRYNDTMYYSDNEIGIINEHIAKFIDSKNFFEERQLNYKTGILLYGEPGTGKSTIAKVLSTTYNRSIISINMSAIDKIDFGTLAMLINNDTGYQYIILLEDIDTLYNLNRESSEANSVNINITQANTENEKKVINKLLQFLDSNQSPNNVIFVATTNHIDKLDPAILREGRFDLKIEVKGLNKHDAGKFVKSFGIKEDKVEEVLKKYETDKGLVNGRYNQSTLQAMALAAMK